MAADRRVVAEHFVFDRRPAASDRVEKVCLMRRHIAVTLRRGKSLCFDWLVVEWAGLGMVRQPLCQIFLAKSRRPAFQRISFRLRTYILRNKGQRLSTDFHCGFGAVELDGFTAGIVQIAAQHDAEFRIVVQCLDQVRKVASVFPAKQSAAGLRARGRLVGSGDEVNSGEQMHEQVAGQSLAVVGEATPAEEPGRVERPLGCVSQKRIPIDSLLARVGRNGIDPGAAGRVPVGRAFDEEHVTEGSG